MGALLSKAFARVQAARATLLLDHPFFGVLALGLHLVEDTNCETAYTNGRDLGFNPQFVATLNADQLTALIAHEVMHCACGHPWRRDARDPGQWNQAADYAINSILAKSGFKLPDGALLDDAQFDGKWAEWIYDRIPKPPQQPQGQQGQGQGQGQGHDNGQGAPNPFGEVRDAPAEADAPTEADWQQQTRSAMAAAKGALPGHLRETITEATKSHVDWRSLLARYVQDVAKSDYTWTRPNVRYIPSGLYLPSLHNHAMGKLTIAIDTSGSIDTVLLQQFAGALQSIAADVNPSAVDVLYCDTRVQRRETFERGDTIVLDAVGRGGTSFTPVFDAIADDGDDPAVLIYFTDLDGSFPDVAPSYPVIWASYGRNTSAPFGDVVPCE